MRFVYANLFLENLKTGVMGVYYNDSFFLMEMEVEVGGEQG